jgi:hypothetical protein
VTKNGGFTKNWWYFYSDFTEKQMEIFLLISLISWEDHGGLWDLWW